MNYIKNEKAPFVVQDGLDQLFEDHAELSDLIFYKADIMLSLRDLATMARGGHLLGAAGTNTVWLRNFSRAMRQELDELDASLAKKWWRKDDKTDIENVRVEIIDIFHFLLSAAMSSGMTGADFAKVYYNKRNLNYERQMTGFVPGDNEAHKIGVLTDEQRHVAGVPKKAEENDIESWFVGGNVGRPVEQKEVKPTPDQVPDQGSGEAS